MVKAVILVGGPGKGTRFRPLSLEVPKPLFPLAGRAMIEHHIKACSELNDMQEVGQIFSFDVNKLFRLVLAAMYSYRGILKCITAILKIMAGVGPLISIINHINILFQVILIGSESTSEMSNFTRQVGSTYYLLKFSLQA